MNTRIHPERLALAFLTPALLLLAAGTLRADCGRLPTDSTFVPDGTSFPNYRVDVHPTSVIDGGFPSLLDTRTITINRVVGPGTPGEFDSNGFLTEANWQTYVANGVLARYAYLQVGPVGLVETALPTTVGIYLNGQPINGQPIKNMSNSVLFQAANGMVCVEIETRWLKFAQRRPGQAPSPAINVIGLSADGYTQAGLIAQSADGGFGTLTFQAMAPVLMVHGWHEFPSIWGPPNPDSQSPCGIDPKPGAWPGSFNFIQPLIDAKVPFDCTLEIDPTADNSAGAAKLKSLVIESAASFGVKHVHLVGHSKGGIWIREMLPSFSDANIGIYSVTTVSTPHHGSPLADMVVGAHNHKFTAVFLGGVNGIISFVRSVTGGYDRGAEDLTVQRAAANNARLGPPPDETSIQTDIGPVSNPVKYYYIAADADTNHNGLIDSANQPGDEGFPFGKNIANWLGIGRTMIANGQYQFLRQNASVIWRPGHHPTYITTGAPFKNDLAVQVVSMQYTKFTNLVTSTEGFLLFNHRDEMEPFTANLVLSAIRASQPAQ